MVAANAADQPGLTELCRGRSPGRALWLDHAELHPAGFADHALIPRRIPDELDVGFVDAVDRHDLALRVVRDHRPHAAAGSGESHFDFHLRAAVVAGSQLAVINQTEIDN